MTIAIKKKSRTLKWLKSSVYPSDELSMTPNCRYNLKMRLLCVIFILCFAPSSFALCVSAKKANLRSGPGSKYPITWVAPQFTPLVRLDSTSYWYKVSDQDGKIHWVFVSAVTSKFKCSSVRVKYVDLRLGPGTRFAFSKYRAAEKYESFILLKKKRNWFQLKSSWGETFWASRKKMWLPIRRMRLNY